MKNVSFIIPNYNAEKTIGKTIESIQLQKYNGKIEIIVIDDNSKDDSVKIISNYKNIIFIKNKKNLGLSKSLNKGIKQSKNNLISLLWCDCILENDKWLNTMVETYEKNKKSFIGSKLIIPKNYWKKFSFYDKVILSKDYEISLKNKQKEGRPTLFNKKLLLKIGLYDDKTFRIAGEDTDLRWKLQEKGYKLVTAPVNILHLHGFYNLSFKKQLLNKALPLAEAIGVNFFRYGFKSFPNLYWNPITSTILYLSLLIPYVNIFSLLLIFLLVSLYTLNIFKYVKDIRIIFIPFFKILKDFLTIIGFWKGFFTKKQTF